ncbi:MAG: 3-dehydroquinate synthase [Sandaracinaceae bacterium]|nr:3-dehydroquinate synthase [Sandaracinaceae bacterium]
MGWVFLSGMMGSGKSSVGRALARRLGMPFVDLDEHVAAREGRSVRALFHERGEASFRELEASSVAELIAGDSPCVVALGGGTVVRAATRRALLAKGRLITLTAPVEELARRLRGVDDRPLLGDREVQDVLTSLVAERGPAYAECFAEVSTAGLEPAQVTDLVAAALERERVVVPLGLRTYRVEIGAGSLEQVVEHTRRASSVVLVTDAHVERSWAARVRAGLGRQVCTSVVLEPGEEHKTLASVERIWDAALDAKVDRDAVVVAVGGGVVGDLAGFAASTLLRGVALVQAPTSLLAMVDSSVGGKTGFDRAAGKNLVGTFHQPTAVLCDVAALATLPQEELCSGLAEVVKAAWLAGEGAVAQLERDAEALAARDVEALTRAVVASVALKAEIVADDERDRGRRALLNLGHTVGHALEAASHYRGLRHGEAVGLGMLAAFAVEARLGASDAGAHAARVRRLLERLGLPTDLHARLGPDTLAFVATDKKRRQGAIGFVLPGAPGCARVEPVTLEELRAALEPAA